MLLQDPQFRVLCRVNLQLHIDAMELVYEYDFKWPITFWAAFFKAED